MIRTTIAVVDDHPVLRHGVAALLRSRRGYQVVGEGADDQDALAIVREYRPDILLIDIQMPGDVFDAIVRSKRLSPETKIVAFTVSDRIDHALTALDAGADGYVLKGSTLDQLLVALEEVQKGQNYVTPSLSKRIIESLRKPDVSREDVQLTIREEQIVNLLSRGYSNKMIASRLDLSEKTVKHYMTEIIQKLKVSNRVEVVLAAQRLNLLRRSPANVQQPMRPH